jgi:Icc-related predicted phosphoesterase
MNITCFSDTHGYHRKLDIFNELKGDILIFSGDYQKNDKDNGLDFLEWFNSLDFKKKIMTFGNHDTNYKEFLFVSRKYKNLYILNHQKEKVMGIKFFGSPYTSQNGCKDFQKNENEMKEFWNEIPNSTEILITHNAPFGILDKSLKFKGRRGSSSLFKRVKDLNNLKYHFFGHNHEGYGKLKNGKVQFCNSAILDKDFKTLQQPIIFEL